MPVDHKNLELKEKFFALRAYIAGLNQIDVSLARAKEKKEFLRLFKKKYELIDRALTKFTDANLLHRLKNLCEDSERLKKLGLKKRDVEQMKTFFAELMPELEDWREAYHALYDALVNESMEDAFSIIAEEAKKGLPKLPRKMRSIGRAAATFAASILLALSTGCSAMGVKVAAEPVPTKSETAITLEGCYRFPDLRITKKGNTYYMIGKGRRKIIAEADAKAKLLQFLGKTSATLVGARALRYVDAGGDTYVLMSCPVSGIREAK